jgi:hypothetical protein
MPIMGGAIRAIINRGNCWLSIILYLRKSGSKSKMVSKHSNNNISAYGLGDCGSTNYAAVIQHGPGQHITKRAMAPAAGQSNLRLACPFTRRYVKELIPEDKR